MSVDSSGKFDNSEFDGLVGDYNTANATTLSPSKACIEPAHYRQTAWTSEPNADQRTFSSTERGLLPYYGWSWPYSSNAGSNRPRYVRYWASSPTSCQNQYTHHYTGLNANPFVNLIFAPKTTGQLIVDISIPFLQHAGNVGYLVVKSYENETKLHFVKDSGINGDRYQSNNIISNNIKFTDKVISGQKAKYQIILYSSHSVVGNSGGLYAYNIVISPTYRNDWMGIIDFKSYFDKNYYTNYGPGQWYEASAAMEGSTALTDIFEAYNSTEPETSKFNLQEFYNLMYKVSNQEDITISSDWTRAQTQNGRVTASANMGAAFEFIAYVIRD